MIFDNDGVVIDHRPATTSWPEDESDLTPGLRWSVKRSFLDYLSRLPDGRMSVTDGARQLGDGNEVVWEPVRSREVPGSPPGTARILTFAGDLRYGGHGGLLFVRLADPHVTLRDGSGELSVRDTFSADEGARICLVTFDLSKSTHLPTHDVFSADEVRLTEEGVALFNQVYAAGELFDPFTITR